MAGSGQVTGLGPAPVPESVTGRGGPPRWLRTRWAARGAWATAGIALFFIYLRQASCLAMTSDSAVKALQAWDMLHGNPLLRGWTTSDVSFYTTELPQYLVIEALHGLNSSTVHIAGAMSFTLVVVLAAALAKGRAAGSEGLARVLVAVAIMAAPQVRLGTYLFLAGPDHLGTQVPVLLILLLLDRAPRRWWVPAATTILLTWAQIAVCFTGDRTQVRPVREFNGQLTATAFESDSAWYNPRLHRASFVILAPNPDCANVCLPVTSLKAALGRPARTDHVASYLILTWNKNILARVQTRNWCGDAWPWVTHTTPSPRPCPLQ